MIDVQHNRTEPASQAPAWNLWAYGQAPSGKQGGSPDAQAENLTRAALNIQPSLCDNLPSWIDSNLFVDAVQSAPGACCCGRPEFKRLMERIQPGDRLIVQRMDHLGRDDGEQINTLIRLGQREVWLYVEEVGLQPVDLSRAVDHLDPTASALAGQFTEAQRVQASIDAKESLRARGAYKHGRPIPGYKLVWRGGKRNYQHDEYERVLCREIGARVHWGIMRGQRAICGIRPVWLDFKQRGEVTANGKPWSEDRVGRVAAWMLGCTDRGMEPWVDCDPYSLGKGAATARQRRGGTGAKRDPVRARLRKLLGPTPDQPLSPEEAEQRVVEIISRIRRNRSTPPGWQGISDVLEGALAAEEERPILRRTKRPWPSKRCRETFSQYLREGKVTLEVNRAGRTRKRGE
ncbi:MAG: recombinase family protein [Candidatus Nealsonbacteria bacterium]|nr:recombinase family protein [Candidatus Nealsonbacteria bacterium]